MKNNDRIEPSDANQSTKAKPRANSGVTAGKGKGKGKRMRFEDSQHVKERQISKIKELSDALVAAGFFSLDEQAIALGLSRSTTWTLLKARHKNYGLSGALINRILQRPGLDRRVRAKIIEYIEEKASGCYGHNQTQLRRFKQRLSAQASTTTLYLKLSNGLKTRTNRSDPTPEETRLSKTTSSTRLTP